MYGTPNLAVIGQLIGDPTRTLMLEVLYDGLSRTASELARAAGITPQTASSHLRKLLDAGLLVVEPEGRYRFYRLAGNDVAEALEALLVLATRRLERPGTGERRDDPLRQARICYDHIAGKFGIDLIDGLIKQAYLKENGDSYLLTDRGEGLASNLGIDSKSIRKGRRPFTRRCLDWSERRYHLAGALGAALTDAFLDRQWIKRIENTPALLITSAGKRQFKELGLAAEVD